MEGSSEERLERVEAVLPSVPKGDKRGTKGPSNSDPAASGANRLIAELFLHKFFFTNGNLGVIMITVFVRSAYKMVNSLLKSAYFFFFSFTYFYVGKAYLGFTEKRKGAVQAV